MCVCFSGSLLVVALRLAGQRVRSISLFPSLTFIHTHSLTHSHSHTHTHTHSLSLSLSLSLSVRSSDVHSRVPLQPMVTLDEAGYLFYWHYSSAQLTTFGWFVPLQQYRLRCESTVYRPMPLVPPKVCPTDQNAQLVDMIVSALPRWHLVLLCLCAAPLASCSYMPARFSLSMRSGCKSTDRPHLRSQAHSFSKIGSVHVFPL
jgi:hypothetical protein